MTLSDWMKSHGLSQAEAGARLGVPSGTVCRWLKGDRTPSVTTVLDIEKRTRGAVRPSDWALRRRKRRAPVRPRTA